MVLISRESVMTCYIENRNAKHIHFVDGADGGYTEAAKEIKILIQVMQSLDMEVKLPIVVRVDNVGTIFMAENNTATSRTRHIDARRHFVQEFIAQITPTLIFNMIIFNYLNFKKFK